MQGWGEWVEWSTCSKTCGPGGTRKRNRDCLGQPNNIVMSDGNCTTDEQGVDGEMAASCEEQSNCPIGKHALYGILA